jgi:hypothetical protein
VREGPGLTTTATVDAEHSKHRDDGSLTMVADQNLSKNGEANVALSLWDRAYAALRTEDQQLVENYEKLLSRELGKTGVHQI